MTERFITSAAGSLFTWPQASDAIAAGHLLPRAHIRDDLITITPPAYANLDTPAWAVPGNGSLLTRSAWVAGLGMLVKSTTIFPHNRDSGLPTMGGAATLFGDRTGAVRAHVDFDLLTSWKTAADSLLAARYLAPPHVDSVLIVGAGAMASTLLHAYRDMFPDAQLSVAARTLASAEAFAQTRPGVTVARDLAAAVRAADLVTVATTSPQPVISGAWLRSGQHIDLIGAFGPHVREADDDVVRRATIFVDSREATVGQIGELSDPIRRGVIDATSIVADFYDLPSGRFARTDPNQITVFKNGGGAHIDLMVADYFDRTVAAQEMSDSTDPYGSPTALVPRPHLGPR